MRAICARSAVASNGERFGESLHGKREGWHAIVGEDRRAAGEKEFCPPYFPSLPKKRGQLCPSRFAASGLHQGTLCVFWRADCRQGRSVHSFSRNCNSLRVRRVLEWRRLRRALAVPLQQLLGAIPIDAGASAENEDGGKFTADRLLDWRSGLWRTHRPVAG